VHDAKVALLLLRAKSAAPNAPAALLAASVRQPQKPNAYTLMMIKITSPFQHLLDCAENFHVANKKLPYIYKCSIFAQYPSFHSSNIKIKHFGKKKIFTQCTIPGHLGNSLTHRLFRHTRALRQYK